MNISESLAILGIEPTKDEGEIRAAYLAALPAFNPEDDPAGFMKLRAAYDTALKAARDKNEDSGAADLPEDAAASDPDSIIIREMLDDFPRRMKEEEWEKLFSAADALNIDKGEVFSEKLLAELMAGQYLPRRIWLFFDKSFAWTARTKQLKEIFPPGYIEYVLNGMRYERSVRDDFFDYEKDEGADFDGFVKTYHELFELIRTGEFGPAEELVKANEGGKLFDHPDYQLLVFKLRVLQNNNDNGDGPADPETDEENLKELERLDTAWPDDPFIRTVIGDMLLRNHPADALEVYLKVVEKYPDHYGAKIGAARARLDCGEAEGAKSDAYDLLMQDPFDGNAIGVFGTANDKLVPIFKERLDADPEDIEARYKLSSCYYNLGKYDAALNLIEDTEPDDEHRAKHYELYADLFVITCGNSLTEEDKEILLEYIEAWEEAEPDRQRLKFLPEKYLRLGMEDTALEKADILLIEFPNDPELCRVKAQIYRNRGDEHNAFAAVSAGLDKSPSHAALLSLEALLLEDAGNLGAAVDVANTTLESFPFNLEIWELLARIYDKVGRYDEVLDTLKRAGEFGPLSDKLLLLKAVALFETEDPEGEAQNIFEDYMDKDPDNPVCLEKLTQLYARIGNPKAALEMADIFVDKHEGPYAYVLRGWLYVNFPQLTDNFAVARARGEFRKAIDLDEGYAPAWYQLGIIAYDEGRMEEAAADLQLALDIDSNFTEIHLYLAIAYKESGKPSEALRVLDEGMALAEENNEELYTKLSNKKAEYLSGEKDG